MASNAASFASADRSAIAYAANATACVIRPVDWRDMADDIAAWDDLALNTAEPNPFFESWYLLPALRALDKDHRVQILRFEMAGKLCGILPIHRHSRYYGRPLPHLAAWMHPNCFFGAPLVAQGCEAEFSRALLDWADRRAGKALFLHFADIDLDGAFFRAFSGELEAQRRQCSVVQQFERALLVSGQEPDEYLVASLPKRKRHELQRQFNRLAELGEVRFQWDTDGSPEWAEQFLALEMSGWKGKAGSALKCDPGTALLLRDALSGAAERRRLIQLSLLLNDEPIAMLANFITPPGSFGFKTAFDESYSRYSPGVLLEREYLNSLTNRAIQWCDSCSVPDHPVMDRLWRERRTIGKLSIAIGGSLRRRLFSGLIRFENSRSNRQETT